MINNLYGMQHTVMIQFIRDEAHSYNKQTIYKGCSTQLYSYNKQFIRDAAHSYDKQFIRDAAHSYENSL